MLIKILNNNVNNINVAYRTNNNLINYNAKHFTEIPPFFDNAGVYKL